MDGAPDWVKGGVVRRGLAFVIDLVVVMVVTQSLAVLLFPLSNGTVIDGSGFVTFCEPTQSRPANVSLPNGFQPNAESICTKRLLGRPISRFYMASRQDADARFMTSVSYPLNDQGQTTLAFDLSLLQWPLLALMRWLLEIRGRRSIGRLALSLCVLSRSGEPAGPNIRPALDRRYVLFALPSAASVAISLVLVPALHLGIPLPNELPAVLSLFGNLPLAMAVVAALIAIMRGCDTFYDEAARTIVIRPEATADEAATPPDPAAEVARHNPATDAGASPGAFRRIPWATLALSAILALVFLGELAVSVISLGSYGIPGVVLVWLGAISGELVLQLGQWYRLVLAMFLHWSTAHLIANVALLIIAGWLIEPILGIGWLIAVFLFGGLAASLSSVTANPAGVIGVGASGAVLAVIAAGLVLSFRLHDDRQRTWLQSFCIASLLLTLLSAGSFADGSIDRANHLGGAIGGATLGLLILFSWSPTARQTRWGVPGLAVALILSATMFLSIPRSGFGAVSLARLMIPPEQLPKTDAEWFAQAADLVRLYPRDPRSHLAHAVAVGSDQGARERALALVSKTQRDLSPDHLARVEQNAFAVVGEARLKARDWEAARELLTRAIMTAPPKPEFFGLRARAELALGRLDAALDDTQTRVRLQPSSTSALISLADILFTLGRQSEALERLDAALALEPENFSAIRYRGWIAFFDGRTDEAIQRLEQAVTLQPTDAYAALWLHIASVRADRGERISSAAKDGDPGAWPAPVVRFYRGEIDQKALLDAADDRDPVKRTEQLCEAHFYIGEWHLMRKAITEAGSYLIWAESFCPKTFYEWGAARAERRQIAK